VLVAAAVVEDRAALERVLGRLDRQGVVRLQRELERVERRARVAAGPCREEGGDLVGDAGLGAPQQRGDVLVGVLLRLIDSFRVYDIVFMTTRGGPIDATSTMSWQIYDVGFRSFTISYAAAYSWLLLLLVLLVVNTLIRRMSVRD